MTASNEERLRAIPVWQNNIEWQPLSGGLSNESFVVTDTGIEDLSQARYVARFGRDFPFHHVSREREIAVTEAAVAAGFAPELCYARPGVMVSRFIDGKTYTETDVQAAIPRIATLIRRFHQTLPKHISGPAYLFWVFHVIRDYARTLQAGNSRMTDRLPGFLELAEEFEAVQIPLPIVFGHHDLLPANFIDDGDTLWLIDYEYAGFSTAMFDLAGIASNAGFDAVQSTELLTTYFDGPVDQRLMRSHAAMQCASLLREAMWSLVSELYLEVPGVDYIAYTDENLARLSIALADYRNRFGS